MKSILLALALIFGSLSGTQAQAPRKIAIKAARLIDTSNSTIVDNPVILIEGERITAVGSGAQIPAGFETIDLGAKTALPGLIDCHTHLTSNPGNYYEDLFRKS